MTRFSRILAIDVGLKRVGLAQTDLLRTFASPLYTCQRKDAVSEIQRIVSDEPVEKVLVGWPLNMDGTEGPATKMAGDFIKELKKAIPDLNIEKVDERLSSQKAVEHLVKAGVPRKKRAVKERIDSAAAALLLQEYLENEDH